MGRSLNLSRARGFLGLIVTLSGRPPFSPLLMLRYYYAPVGIGSGSSTPVDDHSNISNRVCSLGSWIWKLMLID